MSVRLNASAQQLQTVKVAGKQIQMPSRYVGIAERVEKNHGVLFTAEDFIGLDRTKDVLLRLPGVYVNDRSITVARCQDSGTLHGGAAPKVQVYVDGVRLGDANAVLSNINPTSVAMMEVYTGIARVPAEYLNDACAVIAIWTKAY